ncbi:MAG TPA: DNA polymerase III subunit gamma/tau [Candidatus Saccharibacteria bacterium]|nr:DNA polymerase III subunit gamma/tau [Candidatus Saccharibacteria bacterium]
MAKALYRKYRSRSFDEVVGQEHITDTLKKALKKGAISHAYLFTGPRGVGKTSIARILAYAINDLPYSEESTHLDIIEIDAASNRRIDEIRDLRDKVHIAPASAKYKVYIIDEVHMLTREAFNALLKTLEEPPEHAVFILATTEAHKVPDTIVSRTQKFTFKPISTEKAIAHLKTIAKQEGVIIDDDALKLLSEHGRGSFRDSISMLDQLAGLSDKKVTSTEVRLLLGIPDEALITLIIEAIASSDINALFASMQQLREQGVDSGRAARSLSESLRSQLLSQHPLLPQDKIIALLKRLLPLTNSSNDYIGLEVSILDLFQPPVQYHSNPIQQTTKPSKIVKNADTHQSNDAHAKPPVIVGESNESPEKQPQPTQKTEDSEITPTNTKPFDSQSWNTCLHSIKSKYNTLYGVLRMAEPVLATDNSLTLLFKFSFHKKQIDNPRNTGILREYFKTQFGIDTFTTTVDKHTKPSKNDLQTSQEILDKKEVSEPTDSAISSVSNIFGGAELLES